MLRAKHFSELWNHRTAGREILQVEVQSRPTKKGLQMSQARQVKAKRAFACGPHIQPPRDALPPPTSGPSLTSIHLSEHTQDQV